jgi:hypothetical protein
MTDSTQAASNYADELQRQIPLRILISSLLTILLYWGAKFGDFHSALLGAINLSIGWFINNKTAVFDTPIYIYVNSLILGVFGHLFVKKALFSYITFIQSNSDVQKKYAAISNDVDLKSMDESSLASEYQLLLRPDEVSSRILNALVLKVAHHTLGVLLQHRHVRGCRSA